jgi:hypothetical protein
MPADPITDKAVDAAARAYFTKVSERLSPRTPTFDDLPPSTQQLALSEARAALEAAVPHLADQPATTGDLADVWPDPFGHWTAEEAEAARAMKRALLSRLPLPVDRDTCTEPLPVDGDPEAMQTCDHPALPGTDRCPIHDPRHQQYLDGLHAEIRHLKQTAADRDTETAAPGWQVGDKAVWRGREVKVLAVDQVVIEDLGTALTRDADELEQHPDTTRGGE